MKLKNLPKKDVGPKMPSLRDWYDDVFRREHPDRRSGRKWIADMTEAGYKLKTNYR